MPYNGSGSFARIYSWTADLGDQIPITASRMDTEHDSFMDGLSTAICKDGQSTTTARIPFAAGIDLYSGTAASANNMALQFTADTDCGFWRSASNTWHLVCGGNQVVSMTTTLVTITGGLTATGALNAEGALTVDGVTTLNDTLAHVDENDEVIGVVHQIKHLRPTTAANDVIFYQNFFASDNAGAGELEYALYEVVVEDATSNAEDGAFRWRVISAGTTRAKMELSGEANALRPYGNDGVEGLSLGDATHRWTDLFLDTNAVLTFGASSDVTITHAANALSFAGGAYTFNGNTTVSGGDFSVTGDCNTNTTFSVDGVVVVRNQGALIADATAANVMTQLNVLLSRLRTHGLIAT